MCYFRRFFIPAIYDCSYKEQDKEQFQSETKAAVPDQLECTSRYFFKATYFLLLFA